MQNKPRIGQIVEFNVDHPGAHARCGRVVRGYVTDAGSDGCCPRNPTVHVRGLGEIALLREWWGSTVREVPCLFVGDLLMR